MKMNFINLMYLAVGVFGVLLALRFLNKGVGAVDKKDVIDYIKGGALIVDVRSGEEYASGHYANAKNIPVDQVESRLSEFGDKERKIVVYCRSGGRSGRAKGILDANGFKNVVNGGGLSDMPEVK
ncbi:MAG TPA: rhodanese-like domain-containing protein [Leptospiraceae bacterium]|nr:rhodanese-like domain-containing protein [Leptospiraceae bacterium]HMW05321.1 rhodanese-like domain-containing protein [Leptospiraceae bacterium]HMY31517.1 rhodanese-like domain-containing protein [Leptospiraceae bacterium]HNA06671.1 rhodanese-like domain-containing protein [Leptospiraceae bacterium]HNC55369.1 rhodanese-like domain-containing protein [Leptospiraceae bacterium]